METRANHVWVGAVTLGLLVLVAVFAVWLARLERGAFDAYDIYFRQSVDGLAKGTTVSYAGVPAGQVTQIVLWEKDPGFVRVRISVDHKIPILQGTTATILSSFTGNSTILLNGGVAGAAPITGDGPDGAPVIPTKRSDLGALLSNAPALLERLSALTERLTDVLSDKNQKAITGILNNTNQVTAGLADAAPQFRNTLADLQTTLQQASQTLGSFQKVDRQFWPDA